MAQPHRGVIELDDVRFRWPGNEFDTIALDSLTLEAGEHLFVRGASGSGKTTLLNLLAGIHVPTQGRLHMLGTDIATLAPAKRDRFRADHIGVVFQQFNLLPYLTMLENVMAPFAFSRRSKDRLGGTDSNISDSARRLLTDLNLAEELHSSLASELSVGQQQRVAVARALIGRPEILLADEPTSALDSDNRDRFLELVFREVRAQGCTLVFVSHDRELASRFDRVIELAERNESVDTRT